MKVKGVVEDLKIKKKGIIVKIVKIYLGFSLVLLWTVGVSSFPDSSLVQLIFLNIYRPLPLQSVLITGF